MSTPLRRVLSFNTAGLVAAALGAGCGQEDRDFRQIPPAASATEAVPVGELAPGGLPVTDSTISEYQNNAFALASGMKLYNQMNCVGCHFHGGGGIGPEAGFAWPIGWSVSRSFGRSAEARPSLRWSRGHCPALRLG